MKLSPWPVLLLLAAGCGTQPAPVQQVAQAPAETSTEYTCFNETPTGTRFSVTRCYTKEQMARRTAAGEQARQTLQDLRHAPLGDPRN